MLQSRRTSFCEGKKFTRPHGDSAADVRLVVFCVEGRDDARERLKASCQLTEGVDKRNGVLKSRKLILLTENKHIFESLKSSKDRFMRKLEVF